MKQFRNTALHPAPFRNLSNLPRSANQFEAKPLFTSSLQQSQQTLLRPSIKGHSSILTSKELEAREKGGDKVICSLVAQKRALKAQQKVQLRNKFYFKPVRSENNPLFNKPRQTTLVSKPVQKTQAAFTTVQLKKRPFSQIQSVKTVNSSRSVHIDKTTLELSL